MRQFMYALHTRPKIQPPRQQDKFYCGRPVGDARTHTVKYIALTKEST